MEKEPTIMNDGLDGLFEFVDTDSFESEKITAPRYSYWKSVGRVFFRKKSNWVFLGILVLILFMSFVWPLFQPFSLNDPANENLLHPETFNNSPAEYFMSHPFEFKYILGTASNGDSLWNKLWTASRTSLSLAFICTIINMAIGIVLGAIWGLSKRFDLIMTQIYSIIGSIPSVLLFSVLSYVIGVGFWSFVLALTVTGWLGIAFFIRTQVIIIRDREYNLASKTLGTNIFTIAFRNILPFMISVIVTLIATELPSYVSYEVFLSYIGIGLSANDVSIGQMINAASTSWMIRPWQFWPPVIVSAVVSIVLYVVGQNVGDASDPRTHM